MISNSNKKILYFVICFFSVLLGTFVNFGGNFLAEHIIIPLYLDSVLTMFITATFGIIPGLICAFFSNLLLTIFYKSSLAFVLCHFCTVFLSWLVFKKDKNQIKNENLSIEAFLWAGLWSALSNGILGNLIVSLLLKSNTGRTQIDATVKGIYLILGNLDFAVYVSGILTNLVDKFLSAIISFLLYKLFRYLQNKFKF